MTMHPTVEETLQVTWSALQSYRNAFPERYGRMQELYGIPTGGVSAALAVRAQLEWPVPIVPTLIDPQTTLVVDDVYDSGRTAQPFLDAGYKVLVLYASAKSWGQPNVISGAPLEGYVTLPWEKSAQGAGGPEDAVRRLLQYLGVDPDEGHFKETPRRVLSWLEQFNVKREPDFDATLFEESAYDGMVVMRDLPFVSLCAHHLLPFSGKAVVGYIPRSDRNAVVSAPNAREAALAMRDLPRRILGLSKLARIVAHCAKRPTVQENLTEAIRKAIEEATGSPDVAVLLSAEHLCMSFRGPRVPGHETITSSLSGAFMQAATRAEFMSLARK